MENFQLSEARNHEEHVEMLLVHNYDDRIQQQREYRSWIFLPLCGLSNGTAGKPGTAFSKMV
ncbi:7536_t:CDS:2 [Entrophospora sp. SA101]|nr:7536_t:CDS:2 [Entrophospora sp. SA101]